MAKRPEQCEHVSNKGNNGHAPQNALIESFGMRNQKIVVGRPLEVLGNLEGVEASVEAEKDGGKDDGCNGDEDGIVSGSDDDSN